MVGYSCLMDIDEEGTLDVLNLVLDEVFRPSIAKHQGRIVKHTGDGLLAEFISVLNAVNCAIDIQRNLSGNEAANMGEHRIQFRIGINTGDIIIQGDDVFGSGVNVASRLEGIAEPGGICLSRPVIDQVRNLVRAEFVYLGEYQVKNIADPIHAFTIDLGAPARSFSVEDSHAMLSSDRIADKRVQRTRRKPLVFAIGGVAALAVGLGLALTFTKTSDVLLVPRDVTPAQAPPSIQPGAVAEVIKPPPDEDLLPGVSFRDCNFCPEMIVVPAGAFHMGNIEREDEAPPVEVSIPRPFAISRFEVTFEEWDACSDGGGCGTYVPNDSGWGRGKQPVISISWNDAKAYVIWLSARTGKSYRLPSEAEWEYAAQAGSTQRFPWGDGIDSTTANYGTLYERTLPVGSFEPNAFGLYDVIGNVAEWVSDCYASDAYRTHVDYPAPVGDLNDSCNRVVRGGSWTSRIRVDLIRTSKRWSGSPDGRYKFNGLRVLRIVEQD